MAGTRIKIRHGEECENYARNCICCACAAAAFLVLAISFGLDRNTMTVGAIGSTEPIDFSSLAATVIPLDEFWANSNNPPVTASSGLALSASSGMKSDFIPMSGLILNHAAKLQRHLESGTRNPGREPAVLAASWRPSIP